MPPDRGLFGFYTAILDYNSERVQTVNVHLTPFQFKRGGGISDAITALTTTEETHAKEIDAIAKAIDATRATIMVGYFNSISTFVAPQRLLKLGMVDAFASIHENADSHPTWNWPTRPIPLALRIDYIFHSNHFSTTKSEVLRRDGSDHALVFAVLTHGEPSDAQGTSR